MSKLPRITAAKLITILTQNGFELIRQKGSHCHLRNSDTGRFVTVPSHKGKIIGPGLLNSICHQAGISPEIFREKKKIRKGK